MRHGLILLGASALLAACTQAASNRPSAVGVTAAPALNPTGSNGPMSGSPMNANTGYPTTITSAPALNPTGSEGASSGQPSNMNYRAPGTITSAPAANPTGSNGPMSGQPSNMAYPRAQ